MKYLPKNKGRGKKALALFLGIFAIIIVIYLTAPQIFPGKILDLAKPLLLLGDPLKENLGDAKSLLSSKSSLVISIREMEEELRALKSDQFKLSILEKENEELKSLLGRESDEKIVLGRILSKGLNSPHNTLIIDLGVKFVQKNNPVLTEQDILIGFIDEVYKNTSKVRLLSAPGAKYPVEIGDNNIVAEASGKGGGNFEIVLPRGVDIKIGDAIISPNLDIEILGIVEWIDTRPQNSFQKIMFKSPVNINELKWVTVKHE